MPNNNSDNQAKIDREGSVWEVQKADLARLLGEAVEVLRLHDKEPKCQRKRQIAATADTITDALSVLENMEEGEALSIRKNDDMYWLYGPDFAINLEVEKRGPIVTDAIHLVAIEPPAEEPLTLPDFQAGMDRSMWERYGYEAVDDDPEEQVRRRAAATML